MSTDPLVANRYTYVNGDPINASDPTGHHPCVETGDDAACFERFGKAQKEAQERRAVERAVEEGKAVRLYDYSDRELKAFAACSEDISAALSEDFVGSPTLHRRFQTCIDSHETELRDEGYSADVSLKRPRFDAASF